MTSTPAHTTGNRVAGVGCSALLDRLVMKALETRPSIEQGTRRATGTGTRRAFGAEKGPYESLLYEGNSFGAEVSAITICSNTKP